MSASIPALSIKQPWASLIAAGFKDIENRNWLTRFRGKFCIHASKVLDLAEKESAISLIKTRLSVENRKVLASSFLGSLPFGAYPKAAILGVAEIVDCVTESESPWFCGEYGFVIKNARLLDVPIACPGALGFWNPQDRVSPESFEVLQKL